VNERQRDLFLWVWSQRRKRGQMAVALRGALIGAIGGLVFALALAGADAPFFNVVILSVPAFAFIGWLGANRVYASQETMYQSMLCAGARVPEQKPVMQAGDRGPAIAVGIAVAVIVGFIIFVATTLG